MANYIPTIGLEIHVELKTKTKMFCSCLNDPNEKHPNTNVCPICMAHPGTLPAINEEAIRKLIKVGLALNCSITELSKFDRKHYFYPDLPKGYQISQYDLPVCANGWLEIGTPDQPKRIAIERIHMEEDAGKLMHTEDKKHSLVDYNRASVPLMELVTKPDFTDSSQIEAFAKELRLIVRYIDASDVDMEKGQMRVEVNISVAKPGAPWGTKVEVKNINSISAAVHAAEYEMKRQAEALDNDEKIIQETRGWDDIGMKTVSQRTKEGAADYRYFPEPDLPPLRFDGVFVGAIRNELPELPSQRRERYQRLYGLNSAQIEVFTVAKKLGDYFENVVSELDSWDSFEHLGASFKKPSAEHYHALHALAANYMITEFPVLFKLSIHEADEIEGITIKPSGFAELVVRIFHKEITSTNAKVVLKEMAETGANPDEIIRTKDLGQVSDSLELIEAVDAVIVAQAKAVTDYRSGKTEVLKFLVGQVMAKTRGKANPEVVAKMFEGKLS